MSECKSIKPRMRWSRDGNDLIGRMKGAPDEHINTDLLPDPLVVEGYIWLRHKGVSHADIMSGAGIQDRSVRVKIVTPKPPKPPKVRLPKLDEKAKRRQALTLAIAWEYAGSCRFVGVSTENQARALAEAAGEVAAMPEDLVRENYNRDSVLMAYLDLFADRKPIARTVQPPLAAD